MSVSALRAIASCSDRSTSLGTSVRTATARIVWRASAVVIAATALLWCESRYRGAVPAAPARTAEPVPAGR